MPFLTTEPALRLHTDGTFELLEPLVYQGAEQTFTVPAGYVTDFASIPGFAQSVLPKLSPHWNLAAILHDWLCTNLNEGTPVISSRDTDRLFALRLARELGANPVQQRALWTGVRWGGLFNPARRAGWAADAFPVLLYTLAALIVLIAVGLLVTSFFDLLIGYLAS